MGVDTVLMHLYRKCMVSFRSIVEMWPTSEALANDLSLKGVHVRAWKRRNSIPWGHWPTLLRAAKRRGIGLSKRQLDEARINKLCTKAEGGAE